MKNLVNLLSLIVIIILSTASVCFAADNSANMSASATIVVPSTMAKTSNLQINMPVESISVNNTAAKSRKLSKSNNTGSVVAASFTVSGYANYAYSITVPSSVTISNGNKSITIGTEAGSATRSLSADGIDNFSISGKVSFGNNAPVVAMNTNKDEQFPVTVIYN